MGQVLFFFLCMTCLPLSLLVSFLSDNINEHLLNTCGPTQIWNIAVTYLRCITRTVCHDLHCLGAPILIPKSFLPDRGNQLPKYIQKYF